MLITLEGSVSLLLTQAPLAQQFAQAGPAHADERRIVPQDFARMDRAVAFELQMDQLPVEVVQLQQKLREQVIRQHYFARRRVGAGNVDAGGRVVRSRGSNFRNGQML